MVKIRADIDSLAAQLTDLVRNIMRASTTYGPTAQISEGARNLKFLLHLLESADFDFNLYELVNKTVEELRRPLPEDGFVEDDVAVAHAGVKFLIESSCQDGAAKARSSRRNYEFIRSMECFHKEREERQVKRRRTEPDFSHL